MHQSPMPLEDAGYESIGDAFYGVFARFAAQDGARLIRLDGEELYVRVNRAEGLADAHQGASRAYTHYERVGDGPFGELGEDLRPQPHAVLLYVPLRLELRGTEKAVLPPELLRLGQRLVEVEAPNF